MSSQHLSKGSELPPKTSNKIRLYSMVFCPYVQRVRIVLAAKNIPFEIVNVDLFNKPKWLFKLNQKGKVPILDIGTRLISESLDICRYLEEVYPEPVLDSSDAEVKKRNEELLEKFDNVIFMYYAALINAESKDINEYVAEAIPTIKVFEAELAKRGEYFHGLNPGMLDYMIWPWVERLPAINILHNANVKIPDEHSKHLKMWVTKMLKQEAIQESFIEANRHAQFCKLYLNREGKIAIDEI